MRTAKDGCNQRRKTRAAICAACLWGKLKMIWDGIVYRIFATGAVVGVVGVFLAAVSRKREDRIAAMAALSFFVVYTSFHLYALMNPRVLSFEGELTEQYRDSRVAPPLPTTCAYVFDTGEKKKRTVYLDSFTRNKYDEEIVVGREYTVYYEQRTKIILKLEENNQKVSKKD